MHKMADENLKFERLVVSSDFAKDMFQENQYKSKQASVILETYLPIFVVSHSVPQFRG